jgi:hypothetical protein
MDWNLILPLASAVLSLVFALMLFDQWQARRRPYQLVWALGMLWYGVSAGTEWLGGAFGWSEPLYRAWYLIGAIWVAGWLGLGTVFLLAKTRFGYAFALALALAGLFTYLTAVKNDYPGSGIAPILYGFAALVLAIGVIAMTARRDDRWVRLAAGAILGGSLLSFALVVTTPLAAPGYALNDATHIPVGTLFPGTIRLLTPFFNITGAFALTFGALYSAYVFMPKRRAIRYDLGRSKNPISLVVALVAVVVNFIVSVPGAVAALFAGRLNSRVPATILLAIGGFIPAITSGANRFGATSGFFVGEFLGVLFLFAGFLVSVEVFREIRVPFTHRVLRSRTVAEA